MIQGLRRALLIARREYRQHLRTRGFWIGLLLIPAIMVVSTVIPVLLESEHGGDAILLADLSGRYQAAIEQAVEQDYQKSLLRHLSVYAQEYDAHPPGAPIDWARHSLWYSDAEADAFAAAGGIDAALEMLRPSLPATAVPFKMPPRTLHLAPFPAQIPPTGSKPALDAALPRYLKGEPEVPTTDGPRRVIAAVVLPKTLGPGHPGWEMWTNGGVGAGIIELIADAVRRQARTEALRANGLDAGAAAAIETQDPAPHLNSPPLGSTVSTNLVRQLIPVGSAWLLWMTIMMVSNVLLHGLIEERSNKLIESLLATVTAHELMSGKLLGVAGIGLTIAVTWTGFAIASISFAPPELALVLRPALEPYASVATVLGLVFYFVTGYLAIATLFLVIGSMSDSMHDAQAYMTPLIVILLGPIMLVRPAIADPHGLLTVILSWIPIYTPFVMLGRLGTGVSAVEVVTSSLLLLGFLTLELTVAGRIFRASLLRTGQPPKLAALLKLCFAKGLR
jgi:ABC-2 type transport system permease protein